MLPCRAGLLPTPIGPLLGFTIAPGGPEPKSPLGAVSMRVCQSSVMTAVQYPVRSIGAPAFAVGGGPPRPRSCACSEEDTQIHHRTPAIANVLCFIVPLSAMSNVGMSKNRCEFDIGHWTSQHLTLEFRASDQSTT